MLLDRSRCNASPYVFYDWLACQLAKPQGAFSPLVGSFTASSMVLGRSFNHTCLIRLFNYSFHKLIMLVFIS